MVQNGLVVVISSLLFIIVKWSIFINKYTPQLTNAIIKVLVRLLEVKTH